MSMKRRRKYRLTPLSVFLLILLGVAAVAALVFWLKKEEPAASSQPVSSEVSSEAPVSSEDAVSSEAAPSSQPDPLPAGQLTDWNLILLNPEAENKIDEEMDIEKTKFDTQWVDSRAAPAYEAMVAAAKQDGIDLYLRSGYRSINTQRINYENEIQRFLGLGYDEAEAIRRTRQYYTEPGHSEHHSGLAFDILSVQYHNTIYTLSDKFTEDSAYPWLLEHAAEYGFILRYPADKTEITQINFEAWHFRYVGVEHARYITEHGLCLEEYLALFS